MVIQTSFHVNGFNSLGADAHTYTDTHTYQLHGRKQLKPGAQFKNALPEQSYVDAKPYCNLRKITIIINLWYVTRDAKNCYSPIMSIYNQVAGLHVVKYNVPIKTI